MMNVHWKLDDESGLDPNVIQENLTDVIHNSSSLLS
jgi:hypothetical protein